MRLWCGRNILGTPQESAIIHADVAQPRDVRYLARADLLAPNRPTLTVLNRR